ncbi:serine hydrolase [Phenylobacterium sp. LjRoot219]|uniref:serine hydrolase domain-containing protein n=1 Tax=Phenylobacterium sp. LjRoot219 TaxID=3342283 RepID=UPI003ECF4438
MNADPTHRNFAPLQRRMQGLVDQGRFAGVSTLVWQDGEVVHVQAAGWRDLAARTPLTRDTLFRIASMTKPVVSAAALQLVEAGQLALDAPIARWLPEAATLRVLRHPIAELDDTTPLERPPTLFDLMTHTAGFAWTAGLDAPVTRAVAQAAEQRPLISCAPDAFVARICALPLIQQPGRGWYYSVATDLLGVLIARASGRPLPDLLQSQIFKPLGMADTGFWVTPEQRHRLAVGYQRSPTGELLVHDDPASGFWSRPPVFPAAGGGLVSTADDYLRFARMLLDRGVFGDRRILSEASVALLTTNQLTPEQVRPLSPTTDYLHGQGFGLGLAVAIGAAADRRAPGSYGWPGAYSTAWFADPRRRLIALGMGQLWLDPQNELRAALETEVYTAPAPG